MQAIQKRRLKAITGNGTTSLKLFPNEAMRLHGVKMQLTFAASASYDTLAEQIAALTEIRVKVGTAVRRRISGVQLRDYMLLNGTQHDFDLVAGGTDKCQIYLPFAEDWFFASVADSLAWNPVILGAPISIEIDSAVAITVDAIEHVTPDLDAPSGGIITWEVITPVGGGASFIVEKEIEARGYLIQASIYASGGTVLQATVYTGKDESVAFEGRDEENLDDVARAGMTPTASGRTATMFDIVWVRGDALSHALPLANRKTKIKLEASSFTSTVPILLARLEDK